MPKNIKITEKQYRMLQEADEEVFSYTTDSDVKPFDGFGGVNVDGKIDGETNAEEKVTSDRVEKMRTMDGWNRYRTYGRLYPTVVREGVITKGNDANKSDDIGEVPSAIKNNKDLNTLTNDKKDDLTRIPQGVQDKINLLLDVVNKANLTAKQKGIVLNKLIEALNTDSVPYQMQRKWQKNINNGLVKGGLDRSSARELENEAD